ncbi:MAG: ABC transporter permease subunit [Isosphaeraceae bacterium]
MRWGLGPVFYYECLGASRRWQTYALRALGAAFLLAAIALIANSWRAQRLQSWRDYAALGESYFYAIIGVELALVMLAAPAATAGAICVDRARGTLTHVMATDLSDPEIVLGKLAARMLPVLALVACSWPVLAACSLLGGIDPIALTLAFAIILTVALFGCTMALTLSVWARRPHEVVMVVYTFWMFALLVWPVWQGLASGGAVGSAPEWTLLANPFYVAYVPYARPNHLELVDYLIFFAAWLTPAILLVLLAVWRIRPVARRGIDAPRASREPKLSRLGRLARRLPGPSLDGNPVLWREWHRARPSRWLLLLVLIVGGTATILCAYTAGTVWYEGINRMNRPDSVIITGIFAMMILLIFGFLIVAAMAPTSMAEERQRGSLDLLAATTLSTPEIVLGKWLGALRNQTLLAFGPALLAVALATASRAPNPSVPAATTTTGTVMWWNSYEPSTALSLLAAGLLTATILAHGALLASVGLALGTWSKRQGRAIALSVAFALMVGAGWPILIGMMDAPWRSHWTGGLMCLSPFVAVGGLIEFIGNGHMLPSRAQGLLCASGFWMVESLAAALGLVWLTMRTFDDCLGRISDRPRRTPILSDVVLFLAVLGGLAGMYSAITIATRAAWVKDELRQGVMPIIGLPTLAIGLILLGPLAAWFGPGGVERVPGSPSSAPDHSPAGWRLFAARWWAAFRLVPLLSIGIALILMALALVRPPAEVRNRVFTLPNNGGTVDLSVTLWGDAQVVETNAAGQTTVRFATPEEIAKATVIPAVRGVPGRLGLATLVLATILVHGAAIVSLGAAVGTWIRSRRKAVAVTLAVFVGTIAGWVIARVVLGDAWFGDGWAFANLVPAVAMLTIHISTDDSVLVIVSEVAYWDALLILGTAILSGLAIYTLKRRARRGVKAKAVEEEAGFAEADAVNAELQPAGAGEAGSASI